MHSPLQSKTGLLAYLAAWIPLGGVLGFVLGVGSSAAQNVGNGLPGAKPAERVPEIPVQGLVRRDADTVDFDYPDALDLTPAQKQQKGHAEQASEHDGYDNAFRRALRKCR